MVWENIFIFYLSLFPFIVWNGMYEGPKVIYLLLGAIGLSVFWIINFGRKIIDSFKLYDLFFLLFLISLCLSSILGVHPLESFVGGSYRHQGVIFFLSLLLVGKSIATLTNDSKKNLVKVIYFWVVGESLLVLIQKIFSIGVMGGRPVGTIGEPNAVAGFLSLSLAFVPSSAIFLSLVAIVVLGSRSAFISLLPHLIQKIKRIPKIIFFLLIPVGLFIFISAAYFRPASPVEDRSRLVKIAWQDFLKRPLIGYGPESGEVLYDSYFKEIGEPLVGIMIDRSHNLVLDLLVWSGMIGTTFFSIWFFLKVKQMWKDRDFRKLTGVASFLIYSFLQPLSVVHWLILMIIFEI